MCLLGACSILLYNRYSIYVRNIFIDVYLSPRIYELHPTIIRLPLPRVIVRMAEREHSAQATAVLFSFEGIERIL